MTDQNTQDLLDAVASQLALNRGESSQGIPVGNLPADQAPHIDHIDYQEGDKQIWLRLTNGEAWLLRAHRLGSHIARVDNVGFLEVLHSYTRYRKLHQQWLMVFKTAESAGLDTDLLAQAYHDDTLGDDERHDWDRWTPCGTASSAEWDYINQQINAGTLTD